MEVTLQALESKVPLMFRFLSDDDDDVSGAVAQFSQEYIAFLKQMKPLSQKQRENMEVFILEYDWIIFNEGSFFLLEFLSHEWIHSIYFVKQDNNRRLRIFVFVLTSSWWEKPAVLWLQMSGKFTEALRLISIN